MTSDDSPQKPKDRNERREQANRIAAISHRIAEIGPQLSAAIREVVDQFFALIKQIKADSKTAETREQIKQDRSFRWVKIGTISSIVLSVFSVVTSGLALIILHNQLDTMRIEQRAWIKITYALQPIAENKTLIAGVTIKNIGKTPAKRVEVNYKVQKVRKDASLDMVFGSNVNNFNGILNPDDSVIINVPMMRESRDLLNPPLLTKNDVAEIESGEAYIVVFGKLIFFDIYGTSHWNNFCFWESHKSGTYHSRECVEFNNLDDN